MNKFTIFDVNNCALTITFYTDYVFMLNMLSVFLLENLWNIQSITFKF